MAEPLGQIPTKRLLSFDALKLFAIYLVIWGHCIQEFNSLPCHEISMYRYIYSFHMPLFMMISGFFSVSSLKLKFIIFIKKKFKDLIYPVLAWGSIGWIVFEAQNSFHYGNSSFCFWGLFSDYYWIADFWFLKSCFICYVLAYLECHSKIQKKYSITMFIVAGFAIIPFHVWTLFPCFILGRELRQNKKLMKKILDYNYILLLLFFIMLLFWNAETWNKSSGIPNIQTTNIQELSIFVFYKLYRLLIGIIGSLAFMSVFLIIFKKEIQSNFIKHCIEFGQYTLEIYLIQFVLFDWILNNNIILGISDSVFFNLIETPFIACIILLFCIAIAKAINQSTILKKLLLGKF